MLTFASRFRPWKLELVLGHIHAASAEGDSLGFQAQALFESGVSPQFDFTAHAQDAMPGQSH